MNPSEIRDIVHALTYRPSGSGGLSPAAAREQVQVLGPEDLGSVLAAMLDASRLPDSADRWREDVKYVDILTSIGKHHRQAVIDKLVPLLASPGPSRWAVIEVLAELRAEEARPAFHRLANDFGALPDSEQIDLASALGDLGGPEEARILARLSQTEGLDENVAYEIADATRRCAAIDPDV